MLLVAVFEGENQYRQQEATPPFLVARPLREPSVPSEVVPMAW
jgi:hypothetical protein